MIEITRQDVLGAVRTKRRASKAWAKLDCEHLLLPWSLRNEKMGEGITGEPTIAWGIPALESFRLEGGQVQYTCAGAGSCAAECYARSGNYNNPTPKAARQRALAATMHEDFIDMAVGDLLIAYDKGVRWVRIHDGGDFYSQNYLERWIAIAMRVQAHQRAKHQRRMKFYCYTKMHSRLDFRMAQGIITVVQSAGGKDDDKLDVTKPHSVVFPDEASMRAAGYADTQDNDTPAALGMTKVGLVYHNANKRGVPVDGRVMFRPLVTLGLPGAWAARQ